MLNATRPSVVRMLPGLFLRRMELNEAYLMELDPGCLLQNFYLEAGLIPPGGRLVEDPETAKFHWGWESPECQLRGHFLGHWLSAAAALCEGGKRPEMQARIGFIVDELARCQELNGGEWVGSIPEKYFSMMVPGRYIWSPQYTMHKTIMGLKDVYARLGNETAARILDRLADWYVRWVTEARENDPGKVYRGEQAGMLEVWADLYALTGKDKYLFLVHAYEDNVLFDRLDEGEDALTDIHANASIPLSHGAARLYEVTGEERWKKRTEAFWQDAVTDRGMFATTGCNAGEFWIPPHAQGRFLGPEDQEFCTVYNMVRTAEYVFRMTGDRRCADYIERALYNGFLAQQNRKTGMPAYFLPMAPGSRKKWGSKTRDFWCCFGTMVQAQAMYPELIWYTSDRGAVVSQYIPSEAELAVPGGKARITQDVYMKSYSEQVLFDERSGGRMSRWSLRFTVSSESRERWELRLRVPVWCAGEPELALNGEKTAPEIRDGYITLDRVWGEADELTLFFPSRVVFEPLEGAEEMACAVDGPVVLAALADRDRGIRGAEEPEEILLPDQAHTYGDFTWTQGVYQTRRQPENFRMVPLYDVTDETYTVYLTRT